jgi:hypothetical protein
MSKNQRCAVQTSIAVIVGQEQLHHGGAKL